MLSVKNLNKSYGGKQVLNNINFDVSIGSFISITGASGQGKSTLLYLLGLIDKSDSGEIIIDGFDTSKLKDKQLTNIRKTTISIILQNFALIERKTVIENIKLAQKIKGASQLSIDQVLTDLEIIQHKNKLPKELSGGEKQRVAIARALLAKSKLLLLDEPTGNLDNQTSVKFQNLLLDIQEKYNLTIILVTHDLDFAAKADIQYELNNNHELVTK